MKLVNLIKIKGVFTPLARIKIPSKTAYKLWKLIKAIEVEEEFFKNKLRDLYQEYGQLNGNGNYIVFKDKEQEFKNNVDELGNIDITLPETMFTLDEIQNLSLSIQDIEVIKDFIKEETNG